LKFWNILPAQEPHQVKKFSDIEEVTLSADGWIVAQLKQFFVD
jgi:hypothetical protein